MRKYDLAANRADSNGGRVYAPDRAWREQLPEAKPAPNRRDEPYYLDNLASSPARVTLNLVRAFFREMRQYY